MMPIDRVRAKRTYLNSQIRPAYLMSFRSEKTWHPAALARHHDNKHNDYVLCIVIKCRRMRDIVIELTNMHTSVVRHM